jgi:Protein of unknown function, DUF547
MSHDFACASSEFRPVPIRLPMRLYMRAMGVSQHDALNCGQAKGIQVGADIGERLKATMNRWRADGLDIETGRVDYQKLAQSEVFEEYRRLVVELREFDPSILTTVDQRKAFWIDIYNVLIIHGVIAYGAKKSVQEIKGAFERIAYIIGDLRYSLDDIENGILRSNRAHIAIPGVRFAEQDPRKQFVLDEFDPRIHFTLVCGSVSCPAIGIYHADNLDSQLDLAARHFINNGGVVLHKEKMAVSLSRIFQWFSSDFGGGWMGLRDKTSVLNYVSQYILNVTDGQFIKEYGKNLKVSYQKYDWSLNV